jgi:predicted dehydrogenase
MLPFRPSLKYRAENKMSKKLGYGLISVGWMGRLHARSLGKLSDLYPELGADIRFVIAADPVEAARKLAVESIGFESATADYMDVINHPDIDIVSICSPNFLHHEIAMAAIAAGKDFWIEKPMGRNEIESREIAEAAADKKLMTAVGFNYRHAPALMHARKMIKNGELGEITNVHISFVADYVNDPEGAFTWRFENKFAGSGVFGDLLSHGFDLAQFVVGDIDEVMAQSEIFIKERREAAAGASHFSKSADGALRKVENEDYASGMLKFKNGARGTFESSRIAVGPSVEYSIEVRGSNGTIRWNFERLNELEVATRNSDIYGFTRRLAGPGDGEYAAFQPGRGLPMGFDDLKTIEAALFVKSVLTREQVAPSVADCYSAAQITAAAKKSIETGTWQKVLSVSSHRSH